MSFIQTFLSKYDVLSILTGLRVFSVFLRGHDVLVEIYCYMNILCCLQMVAILRVCQISVHLYVHTVLAGNIFVGCLELSKRSIVLRQTSIPFIVSHAGLCNGEKNERYKMYIAFESSIRLSVSL